MVMQNLQMNRSMVRDAILEWLVPLTEDGTMDVLFQEFVTQLAPLAAAAARHAIRENTSPDPEAVLVNAREFFGRLLDTMETIRLNPDMMAVSHQSWEEVIRAMTELRNWIDFLDRRFASPEVIVQPTADAMMSNGGVP